MNLEISKALLVCSEDKEYLADIVFVKKQRSIEVDISIKHKDQSIYLEYQEALEFYNEIDEYVQHIFDSLAGTIIELHSRLSPHTETTTSNFDFIDS